MKVHVIQYKLFGKIHSGGWGIIKSLSEEAQLISSLRVQMQGRRFGLNIGTEPPDLKHMTSLHR